MELLLVVLIVASACIWFVRIMYKALKGGNSCCSGKCKGCDLKKLDNTSDK